MKYLAAYALLSLAGNKAVNGSDLELVLEQMGVKPDHTLISDVVQALHGKELHSVIAEGLPKLKFLAPEPSTIQTQEPAPKMVEEIKEKEEVAPAIEDDFMDDLFSL